MTNREKQMLKALKLAQAYLGKAVADDLMANCARPPKYALDVVSDAIKAAEASE